MPSEVDPSSLPFDDDNMDDAKHNVDFSCLPWELEAINLDTGSSDGMLDVETSITPKSSDAIVKILPGFQNNTSLNLVKDADEDINEEEKNDKDVFEQIDAALGEYYKTFDRNDYFNQNGEGKFLIFCKVKGWNDENELEKYFGNDTEIE